MVYFNIYKKKYLYFKKITIFVIITLKKVLAVKL